MVNRSGRWLLIPLAVMLMGAIAPPVWPQTPTRESRESREQQRERNQRMADIFTALGVRPGAAVADIGAGSGFYTVRLSRAVGDAGKVFAVDISDRSLRELRDRVTEEGLKNVEVVKGEVDDPRLAPGSLDAVLIVNAYHEMTEHQAMLERIRQALKPGGRLVIVEPVSASRRQAPRAEQVQRHEIAPELVQADARAAGFRIAGLEDPFASSQGHGSEWMLVLAPAGPAAPAEADHDHDAPPGVDMSDPALRISADDVVALQQSGKVIVLDVRDESMYARGRIPGARLAPMSALRDLASELKASGLPIVTYCSCVAEETSVRALLALRKLGVTNVRALTGGFDKWENEGRTVTRGS